MSDFARLRRTMVDCQVRTFDVTDRELLEALEEVPRERFVPSSKQDLAYNDQHLVVAGDERRGRFLLAPLIFARLVQALEVTEGSRVLDIGCATGYGSVVLAKVGASVTALESDETAAQLAADLTAELGEGRVKVVTGPLHNGWAAGAPYDAILINGTVQELPQKILEQLADGGRLIGVEFNNGAPNAVMMQRNGSSFSRRIVFDAPAPVLSEFAVPAEFVF